MEIPEDLQGRYSELSTWIRGPVTEDTTMPSELGLLSVLILIERLAAAQERIKVLTEALRKAEQLTHIATDWDLCEVEIDDEMVSTYRLGDEFRAALKEPPCS